MGIGDQQQTPGYKKMVTKYWLRKSVTNKFTSFRADPLRMNADQIESEPPVGAGGRQSALRHAVIEGVFIFYGFLMRWG